MTTPQPTESGLGSRFDIDGNPLWEPQRAPSKHGVMICGGVEFPVRSITVRSADVNGAAFTFEVRSEMVQLTPGDYFSGGPITLYDPAGRLAWTARYPAEGGLVVDTLPHSLVLRITPDRRNAAAARGDRS